MYEEFYGLRERPFDLSPNPRFLFLSKGHREALMHLRYGFTGRPGVTLLVGEAGTGKTTLVRAALQAGGQDTVIVHLSNPTLTRAEFFEYLTAGFGFSSDAAGSKTIFLRELEEALGEARPERRVLALIVDEAQSLPHDLLEEIRLLTNCEVQGRSLAVALVGQPELASRLNEVKLRQLKQRVALRCELAPLNLAETAAYVAARVRTAGGKPETLFTRDALLAIYTHAKGIPRTISVICDNALVTGFAADLKPVSRDIVMEVCRDFELDGTGRPVAAAAQEAPAEDIPEPPAPVADQRPIFSGLARPRRFSFF